MQSSIRSEKREIEYHTNLNDKMSQMQGYMFQHNTNFQAMQKNLQDFPIQQIPVAQASLKPQQAKGIQLGNGSFAMGPIGGNETGQPNPNFPQANNLPQADLSQQIYQQYLSMAQAQNIPVDVNMLGQVLQGIQSQNLNNGKKLN